MSTVIRPYNRETIDSISGLLREYRNMRDYRYLFSSKEWILSLVETYEPMENFLVQSESGNNYFSLSVSDESVFFTGDPFNDFNGAFIQNPSDEYDFAHIRRFFRERREKMLWRHLFEEALIVDLEKYTEGTIEKDAGVSLKIVADTQSYDELVSKRILRMYRENFKQLSFYRAFGNEMFHKPHLLGFLLSQRTKKLMTRKGEERNASFETKFSQFIEKLCANASLWQHVYIDYCVIKTTNELAAMSLNFTKDKGVICYLRAHIPSPNKISYGLILDYWSNHKSIKEGITTIDFTRGGEPYKYRLGAKEYYLSSFEIP